MMTGMRAIQAERAGRLVYDADCGFCTRFAQWVGPSVSWQELDLAAAATTEQEMRSAAGWLDDGRVVVTGADAISAALVARGGAAGLAGRIIARPPVRGLARVVYRVVARNRHRMPGGTPSCRVPSAVAPGPRSVVMVFLMFLIAMAGLVSLSSSTQDREPFPTLLQPPFGYNRESPDGTVTTYVTRYEVVLPDGSRQPVASSAFIPDAGPGPYSMARSLMADPVLAQARGTRAWLAVRLDRQAATRGAVSLSVSELAVTYDSESRRELDRSTTPLLTLDLSDVR